MLSEKCACGVRNKAHKGKSRRNQLPGLATDRYGRPVKFKAKRRIAFLRARLAAVLDEAGL